MNTKLRLLIIILIMIGMRSGLSREITPVYYWNLDKVADGTVTEQMKGTSDTIEGNYTIVKGVKGEAIRLDGFTSVIRNKGNRDAITQGSVSTEAWVALAAYPWNWCPVVAQSRAVVGGKEASGGFSMGIGPRGELGFRIFIEGNEILCVSDGFAMPLFKWVHVAASYDPETGLSIYINGKEAGHHARIGKVNFASTSEIRIGMDYNPVNPSNLIGNAGFKP
ncbi:MAG: LamG domain-containing protein, partial [Planctomycetes bacterium]|nr:LamG domain-containing protein [Planctomycetota bacterium]